MAFSDFEYHSGANPEGLHFRWGGIIESTFHSNEDVDDSAGVGATMTFMRLRAQSKPLPTQHSLVGRLSETSYLNACIRAAVMQTPW